MNLNALRPAVRAASLAAVATATFVLGAPVARGDESSSKMAEAQADFDEIDQSLAKASGNDCVTMCKALQSLARAAERICALAQSDSDKKRCTDARARLEEAERRVRVACPACSATPPPTSPPIEAATKSKSEAGGYADSDKPSPMESVALSPAPPFGRYRRQRSLLTVTIAPLRLFLPAYVVKGAIEVAPVERISLAIAGGFGSLPASTSGRVSVSTIGGQLRGYFVGGFSDGGIFLGVDSTWSHASGPLGTRALTPGFTLGPVAGLKVVVGPGFTLETHLGLGIVVVDDRPDEAAHDKVVPVWDVRAGWTF